MTAIMFHLYFKKSVTKLSAIIQGTKMVNKSKLIVKWSASDLICSYLSFLIYFPFRPKTMKCEKKCEKNNKIKL